MPAATILLAVFTVVGLLFGLISNADVTNVCYELSGDIQYRQVYVSNEQGFTLSRVFRDDVDPRSSPSPQLVVVYLPGHRGDRGQSSAFAKLFESNIAVYSLDFRESSTAFHGGLLESQAHFLNVAVEKLRSMHPAGASGVVVIGHSMGGVVALTALTLPSYRSNSFNTVLLLNTPIQSHPFQVDSAVLSLYSRIHTALSQSAESSPNTVFISLSGGTLDVTVRDELAGFNGLIGPDRGFSALTASIPGGFRQRRGEMAAGRGEPRRPGSPLIGPDRGFSALTASIPGGFSPVAHDDIVNCGQLVSAMVHAMESLIEPLVGTPELVLRDADPSVRIAAFKAQLSQKTLHAVLRGATGTDVGTLITDANATAALPSRLKHSTCVNLNVSDMSSTHVDVLVAARINNGKQSVAEAAVEVSWQNGRRRLVGPWASLPNWQKRVHLYRKYDTIPLAQDALTGWERVVDFALMTAQLSHRLWALFLRTVGFHIDNSETQPLSGDIRVVDGEQREIFGFDVQARRWRRVVQRSGHYHSRDEVRSSSVANIVSLGSFALADLNAVVGGLDASAQLCIASEDPVSADEIVLQYRGESSGAGAEPSAGVEGRWDLPADRPLVTRIRLPHPLTTKLHYTLTLSATGCEGSAAPRFAPVVVTSAGDVSSPSATMVIALPTIAGSHSKLHQYLLTIHDSSSRPAYAVVVADPRCSYSADILADQADVGGQFLLHRAHLLLAALVALNILQLAWQYRTYQLTGAYLSLASCLVQSLPWLCAVVAGQVLLHWVLAPADAPSCIDVAVAFAAAYGCAVMVAQLLFALSVIVSIVGARSLSARPRFDTDAAPSPDIGTLSSGSGASPLHISISPEALSAESSIDTPSLLRRKNRSFVSFADAAAPSPLAQSPVATPAQTPSRRRRLASNMDDFEMGALRLSQDVRRRLAPYLAWLQPMLPSLRWLCVGSTGVPAVGEALLPVPGGTVSASLRAAFAPASTAAAVLFGIQVLLHVVFAVFLLNLPWMALFLCFCAFTVWTQARVHVEGHYHLQLLVASSALLLGVKAMSVLYSFEAMGIGKHPFHREAVFVLPVVALLYSHGGTFAERLQSLPQLASMRARATAFDVPVLISVLGWTAFTLTYDALYRIPVLYALAAAVLLIGRLQQ